MVVIKNYEKIIFTTMALCTLGFLFSCDTRENNINISRIKIDSVKIPRENGFIYHSNH